MLYDLRNNNHVWPYVFSILNWWLLTYAYCSCVCLHRDNPPEPMFSTLNILPIDYYVFLLILRCWSRHEYLWNAEHATIYWEYVVVHWFLGGWRNHEYLRIIRHTCCYCVLNGFWGAGRTTNTSRLWQDCILTLILMCWKHIGNAMILCVCVCFIAWEVLEEPWISATH